MPEYLSYFNHSFANIAKSACLEGFKLLGVNVPGKIRTAILIGKLIPMESTFGHRAPIVMNDHTKPHF